MKRLICILIITAFLFSTAALVGCNVSGKPAEDSFEAMDTFMSFKAYGENSDSVVSQIREKILRLDSLFSTTNSDSDIYRINKRTSDSVKVDDVTADAVSKSLEICKSVDGVLDISVYPIVREWGFIDKDYKIPDKSRIDELLKCVDYTKVSVSDGQITLLPDMELDLGAVAKGYAADEAIEICKSNNTSSALLNLGGTIAAVGKKPDGSSWNIGVANPKNSADYFGYLSCSDCVAATSGGYERYYVGDDGKTYIHIINPKTGYPIDNEISSVTIVSKNGIKSDALSTALFVMGIDKAEEYWRNSGDFDFIILDKNNKVHITKNIADDFKLADENQDIKINVVE